MILTNRFVLIVLFFFFYFSSILADEKQIDSLTTLLSNANADTTKLDILDKLYSIEVRKDADKAEAYSKQYCELAHKVHIPKYSVKCVYNQLIFYYVKGQYALAKEKIREGLSLANTLNYKKNLSEFLNICAAIQSQQGQFDSAIVTFKNNLAYKTEMHDTLGMANTYGNIANVYGFWRNYEKEIQFNYKAIELFEKIKDLRGITTSYSNIAGSYVKQSYHKDALKYYLKAKEFALLQQNNFDLGPILLGIGICHSALKNYKLAEQELNKAIEFIGDNNPPQKANALFHLALMQSDQKRYQEALENLNKALVLHKETKNNYYEALCLQAIGNIYLDKKEVDKAMFYFEDAKAIAKQIESQDILKELYLSFSKAYLLQNNYKLAYEYKDKYYIISDSLFDETKHKQIQELKTKYETEKQEQQNQLLLNENKLQQSQILKDKLYLYILIIALFFAIITSILFLKYKTSTIKNEKLELERKLLQSQMNPHFLFNALSAIQRYMYVNNPKEAGKYLSKFASFMRSILEYTRKESISLSEEIKVLENYLQLQAMRFDHSFNYSFNINSDINCEKTMIPPMLLQPFIENSIEHGFKGKKEIGEITININTIENSLQFEVLDNGIGLQKSKSHDNTNYHESLGTAITKERVIKLNKKKKTLRSIIIEDYELLDKQISGTRVKFYIPYIILN